MRICASTPSTFLPISKSGRRPCSCCSSSYYSTNVGQYIDVVLENGTVIPCIVGDCKQDRHTNENHSVGADGGAIEFIVETHKLNSEARKQGNVSFSLDNWNSNVVEVHIYDIDYI